MDTLEAIQKRWGCRKFLDKDIEKYALSTVLDAGRYAPSAGNLQDRSFIVVRKKDLKSSIAKFAGNQSWIQAAPVLVVVVADNKKTPDFFGKKGEDIYSVQDTSFAVQNMLLAATELGLGCSLIVGFDAEKINDLLDIEEPGKAHAIIALGYAAEEPKPSSKYPLDRFVFFEKYNSKEEYNAAVSETLAAAKEQIAGKADSIIKRFFNKIISLFKKKKIQKEDYFLGEKIIINEVKEKPKEDVPRQLPKK